MAEKKEEKTVVLPLESLTEYGQVLWKDKNGELFYLEEVKPGVFMLKPWRKT